MVDLLEALVDETLAVLLNVVLPEGMGFCTRISSDMVREEPLVFKPGQFYVLAACGGCLLFVLLTLEARMQVMPAALITIGATFIFRVLAIQFNWKTSPVWQEPPNPPSP